jgi:hypothetical protein
MDKVTEPVTGAKKQISSLDKAIRPLCLASLLAILLPFAGNAAERPSETKPTELNTNRALSRNNNNGKSANNGSFARNVNKNSPPTLWNAQNSVPQSGYVQSVDLSVPPSFWPTTIVANTSRLKPDLMTLKGRIEASRKFPDLSDPVVLRILNANPEAIINQLALPSLVASLSSSETKNELLSSFTKNVLSRARTSKLTLRAEDLEWIDLEKLASTMAVDSIAPSMKLQDWASIRLTESQRFLASEHLGIHYKKISGDIDRFLESDSKASNIPLELFLPQHIRKDFGAFFSLKGRNCFATALSFADSRVVRSKRINLMLEPGHDLPMINNDEFAQALWLGYYELNEEELMAGLKLGDLVVFFDATEYPSFISLKHAVVHVADNIYIHKPSKSAASPIEFVRWEALTAAWSQLTKRLDYKVYRKLPLIKRYQNQDIAIEKILWSH